MSPHAAIVPPRILIRPRDGVRAIGADDVIDYTCDDISRAGRHFDLIVDTAGKGSLSKLRPFVASVGRDDL